MNFQQTYNRQAWIEFLDRDFLPEDFRSSSEEIPLEFEHEHFEKITKIGQVPSLDLPVYEVQHQSENDPRVSLSKGAFRLLAGFGQKRALIIFISNRRKNYRFSLVTIDLKLEGKKVLKEYSNPRRYSFFLGPDAKIHTPQQYLEQKGRIKDFDDLQKRFSVEVVNKEFYARIAELFTRLAGGKRGSGKKVLDAGDGTLVYPGNDEQKRKEFAVRLIGRLVFCWFLKKKSSTKGVPLLLEEMLSTQAVSQNKLFYHNILEPLFFEVFNTPQEERTKKFRTEPWDTIPFLNGGLFSPHADDCYEPSFTGVTKNINTLKVPDDWLLELFTVFETYNFTIDENTSIDVELSIDPEMLGRIFENLLAEINPETGETARKATGSYYTPRPIVEYMVDESLKQYLITKTSLPEEKIAPLLSYSEEDPALKDTEKESIIQALHQVKVIDPACGSGAFPMSILQKILLVLQKLDEHSTIWLGKMLSTIPDPIYRKELKKKRIPNYLHKLGIIRDCIYGVDIQPIAVEISKLRCFLSLIVDEKVRDEEPNRGIEHLPNLEFKFVCANTLIGLPKQDAQKTMFEDTDSIEQLKKLREEYLNSYGIEKEKIEKQFRQVQTKMFEHALQWEGRNSQTLKLSQWNPFTHEPSPWFDPDWMFGMKEGFDIVIGNPPYGATYPVEHKKYFQTYYQSAKTISGKQKGSLDTFSLFIDKGLNIANCASVLSYIVPLAIASSEAMTALHNMMFRVCENIYISTYSNRPNTIFACADQRVAIIICHKSNKPTKHLFTTKVNKRYENTSIQEVIDGLEYINSFSFVKFGRIPKVGSPIELSILRKLYTSKTILADLYDDKKGKPVYYRSAGGRYYNVITNFPTGSTQEKTVSLKSEYRDLVAAILSSNLYYWFLHIYSDHLHIKSYELEIFPIPIDSFSKKEITTIENLYAEYLKDLHKNSKVKEVHYAHVSEYREYYARYSKHWIDKIDRAIKDVYGLSEEEVQYLINYDLEFRTDDKNYEAD